MDEFILEIKGITKKFPGVTALDNVNLTVKPAEVLALCGENGAGKSTLIKILSGVYPHGTFDGEVFFNNAEVKFHGVRDAEEIGITTIYQELELIKELSVAENIFLGKKPTQNGLIDWSMVQSEARKLLSEVGLEIDPSVKIKNLGTGQQQMVEICKALSKNAKVLILDEPTSSLTDTEVNMLFKIIRKLKAKGISSIYISHRLDEVFEIADRVSVLRDGQFIGTQDILNTTKDKLIYMMVGREMNNLFPKEVFTRTDVGFEVKNFTVYDPFDSQKKVVDNVSFKAYEGEILGIAGLMGAGRTELATGIFGVYPGKTTGDVLIKGNRCKIRNSKDAIKAGLAYLSEDRKAFGAVLGMNIKENISLASLKKISKLFINQNMEISEANKYVSELKVKAPSIEVKIGSLSGGNQQKVIIGKWLMASPKVLILDEPTRGIDVAAKYEIYKIMNSLVRKGVIVIMISSDLPEIVGMSDRVIIMKDRKIAGEMTSANINQEDIIRIAIGVK